MRKKLASSEPKGRNAIQKKSACTNLNPCRQEKVSIPERSSLVCTATSVSFWKHIFVEQRQRRILANSKTILWDVSFQMAKKFPRQTDYGITNSSSDLLDCCWNTTLSLGKYIVFCTTSSIDYDCSLYRKNVRLWHANTNHTGWWRI